MNTKIKLYHFTDKKLDTVSIGKFGDNYFTLNDKKASSVKRSFFYTVNKPIEYRFKGCRYIYICKVDKNKIYDITKDKKQLYQGDISKLLGKVKRRGYIGVKYNIGYEVISLLYDIPIYKKITRRV